MHQNRALLATLASLTLSSLGCGEDVGTCKGPDYGRDTVLVGGSVQYGGQAIINLACANCHGARVTGASREGAPLGLDYDLKPVDYEDAEEVSELGGDKVTLKRGAISRLRERQRRVFQDRDHIYQQVVDGLMPPDGMFAKLRAIVAEIRDSDETSPCMRGKAYKPIGDKSSQEVLRNWLACQSPIVEVTAPGLLKSVAGVAGDQFPTCDGTSTPVSDAGVAPGSDAGDAGGSAPAVTIEMVQEQVFEGIGACFACHSEGGQPPNLSSAEASYESLVESSADRCMGKPYVTPGDPSRSFLYEVLTTDPACAEPMPPSGRLPARDQRLVNEWILQGAKRASDL